MLLRSRYVCDYGERVHGLQRGRWARTVSRVSPDEPLARLYDGYTPARHDEPRSQVQASSIDGSDSDSFVTPPISTRTLSSSCPPAPKKKQSTKDVDMSVLTQEPDESNWIEEETPTSTPAEDHPVRYITGGGRAYVWNANSNQWMSEEGTVSCPCSTLNSHVCVHSAVARPPPTPPNVSIQAWESMVKPMTLPVPESNPRAYILNSKLTKCARKHCTNLRMGFGSSRFCVECRPKCDKCGIRWQVKGSFKCKVCRKIDPRTESSESESESD